MNYKIYFKEIKRIFLQRLYKHNRFIWIVYSMGKVGSKTIEATLKDRMQYSVVFQTHFLSDYGISRRRNNPMKEERLQRTLTIRDFISSHPRSRLKLITLVRDPVAREISNVFQNPEIFFGQKKIEEVSYEEALKVIASFPYSYPLDWFKSEFREFTGIDIFRHQFDKQKGYGIIHTEMADILVLKLEMLDQCYAEALNEFTGLTFNRLNVANESANKSGKELYLRIKKEFRLSPGIISKIYDSELVRHFYSDIEIENMKKRWSATF